MNCNFDYLLFMYRPDFDLKKNVLILIFFSLAYSAKMTAIDDWFTWCQSCRHGGHASHLLEWFAEHSECPVTGCNCKCSTLDHTARLAAESWPEFQSVLCKTLLLWKLGTNYTWHFLLCGSLQKTKRFGICQNTWTKLQRFYFNRAAKTVNA